MQRYLYRHFTLPGHSGFLYDASLTLIEKTDFSRPKKCEDYCIDVLITKTPMGLNFDFGDSFWTYCLVFLYFSYWIYTAFVLGLCILDKRHIAFLYFVIDFIQVRYFIAAVILIAVFVSLISNSFHCYI